MKVRVVILDDNISHCEKLKSELNSYEDFEVITTFQDPRQALSKIEALKADILLLEAVMPYLDGEEVLERLNTIAPEMGKIVISSIKDEKSIGRCMNLGASYYMLKPIEKGVLAKKIRQVYGEIKREKNMPELIALDSEKKTKSTLVSDEQTKKQVAKFLFNIGINPKLKGFYFLRDSILYAYSSENELSSVTKVIYPYIAEIFDTESERVERSIRTVIEKAFSTDKVMSYYYSEIDPHNIRATEKRHPTNREFIFTMAEYIKNNTNKEISCCGE